MEPLNFYKTPAIRYLIKNFTDTESQEVDLSPAVPWGNSEMAWLIDRRETTVQPHHLV
jgi:hypothetical protein